MPIATFPNAAINLKSKKDEPIVLYCSHSQRSRRVSKMLADNGFTHILNLNGGITSLNRFVQAEFPCKTDMIVHGLPFKSVNAYEAVDLMKNKKAIVVDVRTAAAFAEKDSVEENNTGRVKGSINMPIEDFEKHLDKIADKSKSYVIVDNSNDNWGNVAAEYLVDSAGYKNVYHLTGGLETFIGEEKETQSFRNTILEDQPAYHLLNAKESLDFLSASKKSLIFDKRTPEEFNHRAASKWMNLGHIKNALNVQGAGFNAHLSEFEKYKSLPVLLYGSNGDAAKLAAELKSRGFTNVNIIYPGMWGMVSASSNYTELKGIREFLADHEGLY